MSACTRQPTTNERTQQRPRLRRCATAADVLGGAPAYDVRRRSLVAQCHNAESRRGAHTASVDTRGPATSRRSHPTHLCAAHHVQPTPDLASESDNRNLHPRTPALTPLATFSFGVRTRPLVVVDAPHHGEPCSGQDTISGRSTAMKGVLYVPAKRSECGAQQDVEARRPRMATFCWWRVAAYIDGAVDTQCIRGCSRRDSSTSRPTGAPWIPEALCTP